ncbi:MAG: outer membrane protein assembly factor BamE [Alphaproteobacteria bacterium]|nr:outer membrane protein assembly factor BamE [Alphaproteobacteria bacterium]
MRKTSLFVALSVLVLASACEPIVDVRGNLPNDEQLALIKPGDVNRDDVQAMLGTPSSVAVFDDETWYYISGKTEQTAFFKPKVTDRRVVAISFDTSGKVKNVRQLGLNDGKAIKPVERVTPTAGNEMTFLEQIFGNVGRFSDKTKPGKM